MCILVVILSAVLSFQPGTEPSEVLEIRELYNEVVQQIDQDIWYRTEIVINPGNLPFPALGNYREEFTFYWDCEAGDRWPVIVFYTGEFAGHSEYAEVLYASGDRSAEVLFYFLVSANIGGPYTEYRTWFSDGQVVYASQTYEGTGGEESVTFYEEENGNPGLLGCIEALFQLLMNPSG